MRRVNLLPFILPSPIAVHTLMRSPHEPFLPCRRSCSQLRLHSSLIFNPSLLLFGPLIFHHTPSLRFARCPDSQFQRGIDTPGLQHLASLPPPLPAGLLPTATVPDFTLHQYQASSRLHTRPPSDAVGHATAAPISTSPAECAIPSSPPGKCPGVFC